MQSSVCNESIVKSLQAMWTLPGLKLRLSTWSNVYQSQWLFFQGLEQGSSLWQPYRMVSRKGSALFPPQHPFAREWGNHRQSNYCTCFWEAGEHEQTMAAMVQWSWWHRSIILFQFQSVEVLTPISKWLEVLLRVTTDRHNGADLVCLKWGCRKQKRKGWW